MSKTLKERMQGTITPDNCNAYSRVVEWVKEGSDNNPQCAAAWRTVWDYCIQQGMEISDQSSGLTRVIRFIESKDQELSALRKDLAELKAIMDDPERLGQYLAGM